MENNNKKDKKLSYETKSCKELSETTEGKTYLYVNRCRTCQYLRRCRYM